MKGLDEISWNLNQANKLKYQLGINNSFAQLQQFQKKMEILSPEFNIQKAIILKSFKQNQIILNKSFSPILEAIAKSNVLQQKFNIPLNTLEVIKSINIKFDHITDSVKIFQDILNKNQLFPQLKNFQRAFSAASGQLATIAISQKKWNLIEDFDEITNEAVTIKERIYDDEGITIKSLDEIKSFLNRIEIKVEKIDTDASALIWKVFIILSFILSLMSEIHNWIPKTNYVTREEFDTIIKEQFSKFESYLKANKEYWTTNRNSKVMIKPKTNTVVKAVLPVDFDVIVLEVNHKWIFISFINPKDSLPQTGWILKKYLNH